MLRKPISALILSSLTLAVPLGALAKTTTLTMTSWGSTEEMLVMKKVCQNFENENPGIKVKYTPTPWTGDYGYLERVLVLTAANSAPDVLMVPYLIYPKLAEANVLLDLTPMVNREKGLQADWTETATEASKWKSHFYGLPSTTDSFWAIVNAKLFQEVGLPAPDDMYEQGSWTMDNMLISAKKIQKMTPDQKKLERVGLMQMGDWQAISPWLWNTGGNIVDPTATKIILTSKESMEGLQYFYDNIITRNSGAIAWQGPYGKSPFDFLQGTGKMGICLWWQTFAGMIRSEKKALWKPDLLPLPKGRDGGKLMTATVHEFSISRGTKNKEAAWKLAKYLSGPKGARVLQKECLWFQSSKAAHGEYVDDMMKQGATDLRFLPDAISRMRLSPRYPGFDKFMPLVDAKLFQVYAKKVDLAIAMRDAERAAQAELDRLVKKRK